MRLNRGAANQVVSQSELAFIQTRFDVLTDIRSQFYSVLAAERRRAAQRDLVALAVATRKAAEGRVRALEGTDIDVLLLTGELQLAEAKGANLQTTLEGLKRKLAATVGIPELPIAAAHGDLFGVVPYYDDAQLRNFILAGNSEVQKARAEILRNRLLLRRAEVEPYPNITVAPCYYTGLTTARVAQVVGPTLMFDVPTWDRNQGNIRSQRGDLDASLANLGVVQNEILGQAANTLAQHRAARQRADRLAREILPTAQRSLELTRSGYDRGLLDISTLLQAQSALIDVNMDLIDSLEDVWRTGAELSGILQQEQFP
jgi:cobalt-zinc-cadmium efflux system outer membrane protein